MYPTSDFKNLSLPAIEGATDLKLHHETDPAALTDVYHLSATTQHGRRLAVSACVSQLAPPLAHTKTIQELRHRLAAAIQSEPDTLDTRTLPTKSFPSTLRDITPGPIRQLDITSLDD